MNSLPKSQPQRVNTEVSFPEAIVIEASADVPIFRLEEKPIRIKRQTKVRYDSVQKKEIPKLAIKTAQKFFKESAPPSQTMTPSETAQSFRFKQSEIGDFDNLNLEPNLKRLNLITQLAPLTDRPKTTKSRDQKLKFADYIDKYYPNISKNKSKNRVPLPGDYDYNLQKMVDQSKSAPKLITVDEEDNEEEEKPVQHLNKEALKANRSALLTGSQKLKDDKDHVRQIKNELVKGVLMNIAGTFPSLADPRHLIHRTRANLSDSDHDKPIQNKRVYWSIQEVFGHSPDAREGASMSIVNRQLVVYGGRNKHQNSDLYILNCNKWSWSKIYTKNQPQPRFGNSFVSYRNQFVIFGGWTSWDAATSTRRVKESIYLWSLDDLEWRRIEARGNIPTGRRNHAYCIQGTAMYVYGGYDFKSKCLKSFHEYDVQNNFWTKLQSFDPRAYATITPVLGGIALFGGINGDNEILSDLRIYKNHIWMNLGTNGTPPSPRFDHTAISNLGSLIICGGRNDQVFRNNMQGLEVAALKLDTLTWRYVEVHGASPGRRWAMWGTSLNNRIFIFGGISYQGFAPAHLMVMDTEPGYVEEQIKKDDELAAIKKRELMQKAELSVKNEKLKALLSPDFTTTRTRFTRRKATLHLGVPGITRPSVIQNTMPPARLNLLGV